MAKLIDNGERLHVESCTQLPQVLRSVLAGAFGHEPGSVRVTAPRLGRRFRMQRDGLSRGDIGSGGGAQTSAARAVAGGPAGTLCFRDACAGRNGRRRGGGGARRRRSSGCGSRVGRTSARRMASWATRRSRPWARWCAVPYRVPNLDARMFSVVTNKTPLNVLRGAGGPAGDAGHGAASR
jgi:CO/xanthine dehydrogenase Mo-binding subunit